jgi:competence ComEA-like helix-hairpin-helix protein
VASGEQGGCRGSEGSEATNRALAPGALLKVHCAEGEVAVDLLEMEPAKKVLFEIPLDLNAVSEEDLVTIPGIGPRTSQEIVAYRNKHGNFPNVKALRRVKGIGKKKLEKLEKYFYAQSESSMK